MNYAPVAITTLNRFNHFKECIESLNSCNWADKTDVFVALDYPPSDKYVEGHNAIKDYLEQATFCFNSLHVLIRHRNYGLGSKGNMATLLSEEIWPYYDRVILSEDDNVFAKTFLQFMDIGLEKLENRNDIIQLGGFAIPSQWKNDGNELVMLNSNANGWGVGKLKKWNDELEKVDVLDYYHSILSSKERTKKILSGSKNDCGALAWNVMTGNDVHNDTFISIYARDNDKYAVFPKVSQTKNKGSDGSGNSSGKKDVYGFNTVELDDRNNMDPTIFDNIPPYYDETMDAINETFHLPGWKMKWIRSIFATHNFWRDHLRIGRWIRKAYITLNPRL